MLFVSGHFLTDTNNRTGTWTPTMKPGVWQEIGSNYACDTSAGERFLEDSPGMLSNIEQCTKSCEASLNCLSITFLKKGWCSHFSTWCTKFNWHRGAVSMRWDTSGLFWGFAVLQHTYFGCMDSCSLSATQMNIFLFNRCISAQSGVNRRRECSLFLVIF